MAKAQKKNRYATSDGYSYLTKRTVVSRARSAGKAAAQRAMDVMGYVVTIEAGWVVKKFPNGQTEQIQQLETA